MTRCAQKGSIQTRRCVVCSYDQERECCERPVGVIQGRAPSFWSLHMNFGLWLLCLIKCRFYLSTLTYGHNPGTCHRHLREEPSSALSTGLCPDIRHWLYLSCYQFGIEDTEIFSVFSGSKFTLFKDVFFQNLSI